MRKMKYIIGILLLFMVIGFATVTVSLSISGNVKVVSDVDDFKVYFSDVYVNGKQNWTIVQNETSILFDVKLEDIGSEHVILYDVTNASSVFDAALSINCTLGDESLNVNNEFDTSNLAALSTRRGILTIKKVKSNASETDTTYQITCNIIASPVERSSEATGNVGDPVQPILSILEKKVGFTSSQDYGGTILSDSSISNNNKTLTVTCDIGNSVDQETCTTKAIITNNSTFDVGLTQDPIITYDDAYIHTLTFKWHNHSTYENHTVLQDNFIAKGTSQEVILSIKTKFLEESISSSEDSSVTVAISLNFDVWQEDTLPIKSDLAVLKAYTGSSTSAFRSSTYKEKIKTITFEDEINVPEDATSWDIGVSQNGNVMAYVTPNETDSTYYDLYIQSDTQLYANENMYRWFNGLTSVDSINGLELLDLSMTTDMSYMFDYTGYNSTSFTLDVSGFDTSEVTTMSHMFYGTGQNSKVFTLDVSGFDTSNVTNMERLFSSAGYSSTEWSLDLSNFDTSHVTTMFAMFNQTGYASTTFSLDLSNFDTSEVSKMGSMFYYTGANSATFTLDVSNFDTSNVTDMSSMFYGTGRNSKIFTLDVSGFDTSSVTDMGSMFRDAGKSSVSIILDVSGFDTSSVTDMSEMFLGAGYSNLTFVLDVSNFDTGSVNNMSYMFYQTGYYNTEFDLDVSNFDTSSVTDMSNMFSYTGYNSTKFNPSITIRNPNTTSYSNMFAYVATKTGSKITVNYTSETSDLVDKMIATKSSTSNVVKGYNESSVISFTIDGATYNAYEGMTWGQWVDSEYNTDLEFNIITFGGSDKLVPAPTDYYEPGVALHYGPAPQSTETVIQHGYAYTLGCD